MKLKAITLAAGLGLSGMAGTASAQLAPIDMDVYISSASALQATIGKFFSIYCASNQASYRASATINGASRDDFRAHECTFKASGDPTAPGLPAGLGGKNVRIYHSVSVNTDLGGSILGVHPIYRPNLIQPTFLTVSGCTADGTDTSTGFARSSCPNNFTARSEIGLSDTEPANFVGPNLPTNPSIPAAWKTPVKSGAGGDSVVSSFPTFQVGFGVPVSNNVISAGVTNITADQFRSILSNQVDNWNQLNVGVNGAPGPNLPIQLCRRTRGSGTQASYNAFMNASPCLTNPDIGGELPITEAGNTGPNGLLTVVESPATSGVRTCLNDAIALGRGAIGIISLENLPTTGWSYLTLDGVKYYDANLANDTADGTADNILEDKMIIGAHSFYMEPTLQYRDALVNGTDFRSGAAGGALRGTFATFLRDNIGRTEVTNQLRGIVSLPSFRAAVPGAQNQFASNYSKGGNACRPSQFQPF